MQGSSDQKGVIREARASDGAQIVRVHIESTADAYAPLAGTWPTQDLDAKRAHWAARLEDSQRDAKRVDLVADLAGSVVGFVSAGVCRRADIAEVEIYVIHVLPEHRGTGFGRRLWSEACKRIRGEALCSMYVATLAELRCCSFYERHGGEVASRRPRSFLGAAVTDVVYIWPAGRSNEPSAGNP
jgi:ribosomal protein S18 acetylase RimI-like enzyme